MDHLIFLEEFESWRKSPNNRSYRRDEISYENFGIFFNNEYGMDCFQDICANIAYQVYQLQVNLEGLLEDVTAIINDLKRDEDENY